MDAGDAIRRRDEILQVMFWLRGEGLGEAASTAQLEALLGADAAASLPADLAVLHRADLVEPVGPDQYRLTPRGVEEGGRRFREEFQDYVHQGHGACDDPSCDCHSLGPEACAHTGQE